MSRVASRRRSGPARPGSGSRARETAGSREASPTQTRRSEPTVSTTMRLRRSLRNKLEGLATRGRRSVAEVAQELLEEALRVRDCPGIYFADEPSGRTAKIGGTGLGVWEVLRDFTKDNDLKRLRRVFPRLSQAQVTAALMYYRRYPEEVRGQIEINTTLTAQAIEAQYPGLIRVVPAE